MIFFPYFAFSCVFSLPFLPDRASFPLFQLHFALNFIPCQVQEGGDDETGKMRLWQPFLYSQVKQSGKAKVQQCSRLPEGKESNQEPNLPCKEKAIKMATPKQVNMIEKILPRMFKSVHDIFLEYHVTSLFQLTHEQVSEIKAKFDGSNGKTRIQS